MHFGPDRFETQGNALEDVRTVETPGTDRRASLELPTVRTPFEVLGIHTGTQ